jgi:hypothetical protein
MQMYGVVSLDVCEVYQFVALQLKYNLSGSL